MVRILNYYVMTGDQHVSMIRRLLDIFEDILNRFNDQDDHNFLEAFLAKIGTKYSYGYY